MAVFDKNQSGMRSIKHGINKNQSIREGTSEAKTFEKLFSSLILKK
jgi:hypothetical protein